MKQSNRAFVRHAAFYAALALTITSLAPASATAEPLSGAIFTTNVNCDGTNINIFGAKTDVYLDGGPAHPGAAGLPDGFYYVKVTEPNGTLLGTSVGSGNDTPVHVTGSSFDLCYHLVEILVTASDGTPGFDTTSNGGGEYKVWISPTADFASQKTDNFKVAEEPAPPAARLRVVKFYDANVNGINDDAQDLMGWKVVIADGTTYTRFTPVDIVVDPDTYTVTECQPIEPGWQNTTATSVGVTLADGDDQLVEFGNVCLGGGGGHTLGYWSNKNGKATLGDGPDGVNPELALLTSLCLRKANGSDFSPTTYNQLHDWLLDGTAVNMAYMLSVQLAAMELNVEAGFVSGDAFVYAPGVSGANSFGFIKVSDLMSGANAALCADGETFAGDPNRATQEAFKNALDSANNNQNFVQATPCPFSFPPE